MVMEPLRQARAQAVARRQTRRGVLPLTGRARMRAQILATHDAMYGLNQSFASPATAPASPRAPLGDASAYAAIPPMDELDLPEVDAVLQRSRRAQAEYIAALGAHVQPPSAVAVAAARSRAPSTGAVSQSRASESTRRAAPQRPQPSLHASDLETGAQLGRRATVLSLTARRCRCRHRRRRRCCCVLCRGHIEQLPAPATRSRAQPLYGTGAHVVGERRLLAGAGPGGPAAACRRPRVAPRPVRGLVGHRGGAVCGARGGGSCAGRARRAQPGDGLQRPGGARVAGHDAGSQGRAPFCCVLCVMYVDRGVNDHQ